MKKILLLLAASLLSIGTLQAVPAKRGFKTFTQADGKSITVQAVGDEFHHRVITQDGLTVQRATDGQFYYATASGITGQLAHDAVSRDAQELSFIAAQADKLTPAAQPQTRSRRAPATPRKVGQREMPTTGTPRIPVLLVNFADKQMTHTKAQMLSHYTQGESSAYQYFVDQSNGKYQPQYEFYGIYNLPSSRATYGGNDAYGNDKGVALMVNDAIVAAGTDVNWSQYDNDGDGYADVVIVVYAGVGEAQAWDTVTDAVWPCNWNLSSGVYYGDGNGPLTRNGVTIDRFAVFNETYGSSDNGTTLDGIGTFCHEYSHCLGLPDFYETNAYTMGYYGMGDWSLMDYGCYNNDGYTPIGYSAYEKNFMGWIDYITPVDNTQYTLQAMNQKALATDQAIQIKGLNDNEYFILENRQKQGWDQYIPDNGLLITHFTYVADRWAANTVNNESMQLATIIPADNDDNIDNENTDCYGKSNHEFSSTSTPASVLNMLADGSLANYTGGAGELDKPVTEIIANSDGTVSLWYVKGTSTLPALNAPVLAAATDVTMNSLKVTWTHTASIDATYTLQVTQNGTVVANHTNITDHEFTVTGLTPSTTYTLQVKAVPVDATTAQESAWSNVVTATTLQNTLPALPAPVLAEATNVTGESFDISWTYSGAAATFTLQVLNHYGSIVIEEEGLTATSYSATNLIMGETYTIKVKAVPADATTAQESAWATTTVTTLTEASISVDVTQINFTTVEGVEVRNSFQIDGQFLDEDTNATITLNDPSGYFSLGKRVVSGYSIMAGAVINVYFKPMAPGTFTATATVTYPGLDPITVRLNGTASISKQVPVMEEASQIQPTSFRASWSAVPNVSSYTLYVDQQAQGAELLLHEDLTGLTRDVTYNVGSALDRYMSNPGWTGKYVYLQNGGLQMNERTNYPAYLTSPELDLTESGGFVTVKFNANKAQTVDVNVKLTVKTDDGSQVVPLETVDAADYTVVLPCKTQQGQKVTFEAQNATNRKLILHDIKIYSGDATQAGAPARASETGDSHSRVITGITDNNYVVTGLEQYGTFNYKVQAIYTDQTLSEMSNVMQVTLADGQPWLRGDVNGDGSVDVGDINILINIMLGKDSADNYDGRAYVTDGDTSIDVADVNVVVNIMLGK
ncbi:MAG: M6 family metalloprotease domain-containing protein [Muribaculaceae bacterium]|nr:M6 family metalloprotease domain-containing protein [Muribaculaceae bacterium]MBR1474690.1 M6 family metalloprotease domain-containing protein [Muribaculaceae bacterium]MBR1726515.1 M6 family metalloprotease domain-containing protein [Muribaculaceae bacterium]